MKLVKKEFEPLMKEFETLMIERLVKIDGVASIESSIPLRRIKSGISRTP